MTMQDAAARTGILLAGLLTLPGVRIFQGVRSAAADQPRVPHAISVGRLVILVESVAWPAGRYSITPAGRVHCDGIYIGQSARPLLAAVRCWLEALPHGHWVSALVVVHPSGEGDLTLPDPVGNDLDWACPGEAVCRIREQFPSGVQPISIRAIAALVAAAAAEENR
jgi:hypothetical protein